MVLSCPKRVHRINMVSDDNTKYPNKKQEYYKKNCALKKVGNTSIMISLVTCDTLGSDVVRGQ